MYDGPSYREDWARVVLGDRYDLQSTLGRGGMGVVFRAWDRRLAREVAVKLLAPALASDDGIRRRFRQEACDAARITHPNVVTIFDADEDGGEPYIVMECLSGETLADVTSANRPDIERVRTWARQALNGLRAAHDLGIVHRDIKPSNLLIAADGSIKIADFGIAKSVDALDVTASTEIMGSMAYLAPERLTGQPATSHSDLYSLGVVLYEVLAGTKPFRGDTPAAVSHAIVAGDHEPLWRRRPDLDRSFTESIERAMAAAPSDRFATAANMRDALLGAVPPTTASTAASTFALADVTTPIEPAPGADRTEILAVAASPAARAPGVVVPSGAPRPQPRHRRRRAAIAVAVATVVAAVVIGTVTRSHSAGSPTVSTTPTTVTPGAGGSTTQSLPAPLEHAMQQLESAVRP